MAWVKIDDSMPDHPKFVQAGAPAGWWWLLAVCWSSRYLTDGFIPQAVAESFRGFTGGEETAVIGLLVQQNLLEKVEGGYQVHDYLDYNPSKDQVLESRTKYLEVKRAGGRARAQQASRSFGGRFLPAGSQPRTRTPSPSLNGFYSLWSLHPGPKGSKKDALKEYKLISPPESAVQAMEAQVAYKRECDRRSIFCAPIPHLHRWIKKMRWEDEIPTIPLTQTERLWLEGQAEGQTGHET